MSGTQTAWIVRGSLATSGVLALLPLVASVDPDRLPLVVPLALVGLFGIAVTHPGSGLVALALLAPLGGWVANVANLAPFRLTEALVLAVLAGALGHHAWTKSRTDASGGGSDLGHNAPPLFACVAWAVALVTVASFAVRVGISQVGLESPWPAVAAVWRAVTSDYLFGASGPLPGLVDGARLVESVALLLVVVTWCERQHTLVMRLARATVVASVGAVAINLAHMTVEINADPNSVDMLLRFLGGRSLAAHINDINATGSYFLMVAVVGAGVTIAETGYRRRATAIGVALALAGLWLAGSRTALAVALLTGFVAAAAWTLTRGARSRRTLVTIGALIVSAAVALPVAMLTFYPERTATADSVGLRVEFLETSARMIRTRPVFGVGVGRYYQLSGEFMSPELRNVYPSENAHNNYMQVTAELGLVGIAAFVLLLWASARAVWTALVRVGFRDALLVATAGGAGGFLITCLTGHPLLVNETAFPFWIVGGLAVARASALDTDGSTTSGGRMTPRAVWMFAVILVVSIPYRVDTELRERTANELSSGLYGWEVEAPAGRRFRWSGGQATLFVPPDTGHVRIPVRALHATRTTGPVDVEVSVGGRHLTSLSLPDERWVDLRVPLARPAERFHRIGLRVTPTWSPARTYPGNTDTRTLGVKVGELDVRPRRD